MNQNKKLMENQKLLDHSFNTTPNVIKFGDGESFEHFLAKALLCYELKKNGQIYVTEARFLNGARCDVFCLSDGIGYEVLHTETKERFEKKRYTYPCPILGLETKELIRQNIKKYLQAELMKI